MEERCDYTSMDPLKENDPDYANVQDLQPNQESSCGKYENCPIRISPPSSSPKLETCSKPTADEPEKVGHTNKSALKHETSELNWSVKEEFKDGERYSKLKEKNQPTSTLNDSKLTFPKKTSKDFEESTRTPPTSGKHPSKVVLLAGLLAVLLVSVCANVLAGLALNKASSTSESYPLQHDAFHTKQNVSQGESWNQQSCKGVAHVKSSRGALCASYHTCAFVLVRLSP